MRSTKVYHKNLIEKDSKYDSELVTRFINLVMQRGKKSVARKIVYLALEKLSEKTQKPVGDSLEQIIENVSPLLEVRGRRIGGANYQIPVEVTQKRRVNLAMRWLMEGAASKKGKPYALRLAQEFIDAYNHEGFAMKKKTDVMKMAEANRAFAHYVRM